MKNSITYILSWCGLIGILLSQTIVVIQQPQIPLWSSFVLILALLPIKGFIQNKRYTFQWSGFLSLFFLCVGVSRFFEEANHESLAMIFLCSSVVLYFGVVFHAKKLAYLESIKQHSDLNPD